MGEPAYKRVVVKLSGESFAGSQSFGIDQPTIDRIAADLIAARKRGIELGVVVGGGNIFRGVEVSARGVARPTGDTMGMLATVMNCLAMEAALERQGQPARVMSALAMPEVCEQFSRGRALKHIAQGRIVLFAGGTGNPYFTTDTTAVLRAAEIGAEAVLKAKRFDRLTHAEALAGGYKVMDATAFALARETAMPIIVFSVADPGAITHVLAGKGRATVVTT
jgi:uridylate kinase